MTSVRVGGVLGRVLELQRVEEVEKKRVFERG
jgi:hypothetical protein